jgi:hypothetical protein
MARPKKKSVAHTKLVQALVSPRTFRRLSDACAEEGISASAFLRRMILVWESEKFGTDVQATGS